MDLSIEIVSALKKNIVANFAGSAWTGLMSLVFVPVYIHFLGIEAYGLMGLFATMLGMFALFDLGLSGTLNREVARLAVQKGKSEEMRDLVRTLEIPYWLAGLVISASVVLTAPYIAHDWLQAGRLSTRSVQIAIMLMGACVTFQWPIAFYSGGLMGLQRQVLLNAIGVTAATMRGLGAAVILWRVSSSIEAFFVWQMIVSAAQVGLLRLSLWRSLPESNSAPRFRAALFQNVWRFAAGMTGIAITATLLMQLDKVILSRILSLENFGYYNLANAVAMTLYRLAGPVHTAVYPQLTRFVQLGAKAEIIQLFHRSSQLITVLVVPVAVVVAFFAREILLLWTRKPDTAENAHMLLSLLIAGTAIHCIMHIPYAVQLAHGWTRFGFLCNIISVLLLVPLMIIFTRCFGAVGAAVIWLMLNMGVFMICPSLMHRRLLRTEKWRWYLNDVARPVLPIVILVALGRYVINPAWTLPLLMTFLLTLGGISVVIAACASDQLGTLGYLKKLLATIRRQLVTP